MVCCGISVASVIETDALERDNEDLTGVVVLLSLKLEKSSDCFRGVLPLDCSASRKLELLLSRVRDLLESWSSSLIVLGVPVSSDDAVISLFDDL